MILGYQTQSEEAQSWQIEALRQKTSAFKIIINLEKLDIFLVDINNEFENYMLKPRQKIAIPEKGVSVYVCSPKDII